MDLKSWEERYRSGVRAAEDLTAAPTPLLMRTAQILKPGDALDLACGSGRNALWLARAGWKVTAVDGAQAAIEVLRQRAAQADLAVESICFDLQRGTFEIGEERWDLIVIAYYLQRDLFADAKRGVRPGGTLVAIAHTTMNGEEPTAHRLRPGELATYFEGWRIEYSYEGPPADEAHKRFVAEVVARKPEIGTE